MQILCIFLFCTFFWASGMMRTTVNMVEIEEFEVRFYPFLSSPENNSLAQIMVLKERHKNLKGCTCASAQLKLFREYLNKFGDESNTQVKMMLSLLDSLIGKIPSSPLTENICPFHEFMPHRSKKFIKEFFKIFNENDCSKNSDMKM